MDERHPSSNRISHVRAHPFRVSRMYVDVHTHLTHEKFRDDLEGTVDRARAAGLGAIVVNGLEPVSNRQILSMAGRHDVVKPALGIYPVDAVCNQLPADFELEVARFDVDAEIEFIARQAADGHLIAVGECGLDGYWLDSDTHAEQERVFESLVHVAIQNQIPVIIHTRKMEVRAAEILRHLGAQLVDFHCYGGKVKNAIRWANEDGWWFSIPANARRNEAFTKMLRELPPERILTETDAPYLAPERHELNEPANVVGTVAYLAELRGWPVSQAKMRIWQNFTELFARA
jgi:TatD DNase family protein